MNQDIFEQFKAVRAYKENDYISLHKPILLLYALAQCLHGRERLLSFKEIDTAFKKLFLKLSAQGKSENSHYPFGKLENDEIWQVTNSKNLKRTSVGYLHKKELLDDEITGGFTPEIYKAFREDKELLKSVFEHILDTYIDSKLHDNVFTLLNIGVNQWR